MNTASARDALPPSRALEYVAALSAIFLFVSYLAGRIYLQAFYGVFHTQLTDLDLSVQDIMFQSWRSFLEPVLAALMVAGFLPWLRRLAAIQRWVEHMERRIEELQRRLRVEGETAGLASEIEQIEKEVDDISSQLPAASVRHFVETHRFLFMPFRLPGPYFLLCLTALAAVITLLAEWWLGGPKSAAIDSGMAMLRVAAGCGVIWLLIQSVQGIWSIRESAVGVVLLVSLIAAIPLARGIGTAYSIRLDNEPGRGLPEITLVADRPIAPSWRPDGLEYLSPPLRWIGQNSTYIVAWDPAAPDHTLYISKAGITRIERKH